MPRPVLDHLYQLTLPTPFAVGPVNVYLATDDPVTLIDTGPRDDPTRVALDMELNALNLTQCDIQRIVITHAHSDHYGLAAEIVRHGTVRAEVWTHPYNHAWVQDYEHERANRLAFYKRVMDEAGVPPDDQERMTSARRGVGRYAEAVTVDREINEADRLTFAGRAWNVLHTPGHAGGMICFFDPASRILLSSDHLLRDISSNPVVEPPHSHPRSEAVAKPRRLVEYVREMQRVADLLPSIAWTGHGEPIHDVSKLVRQRLAIHSRRAQRIVETIADRELPAFEITEPLFGQRGAIDSFLALSEVIGHLEWLEDQHRVEAVRRGEVVYWRRTR
jgi:glyoxylase-like metal-dependent hydrolase (beta-lactamase superfamily II)